MSEQYGTLVVKEEIGAEYKCQCTNCGQVGMYNKYALKKGQIKNCRFCKKFKGIELGKVNAKGLLEVIGYRNNPEDSSKLDVLVKCKQCSAASYMTKQDFIADKVCMVCKNKSNNTNTSKIKPKINLGGGTRVAVQGKDMNSKQIRPGTKQSQILPKSYAEHMKHIEELETQILNDKGILKKNHVGEVYNGLIITKQYIEAKKYRCRVKCTCCDAEYEADLSKVISYRLKCDNCKSVSYTFPCPNCKKVSVRTTTRIGGAFSDERHIFSLTRDTLYSGGMLECPKCNKKTNLAIYAYTNDINEQRLNIISNIETEKYGDFSNIDDKTKLVISKESAYRGRDGEFRYNCYCMEHKKQLCLKVDETVGYDHRYCENNEHMKSVPLVTKIPKKID